MQQNQINDTTIEIVSFTSLQSQNVPDEPTKLPEALEFNNPLDPELGESGHDLVTSWGIELVTTFLSWPCWVRLKSRYQVVTRDHFCPTLIPDIYDNDDDNDGIPDHLDFDMKKWRYSWPLRIHENSSSIKVTMLKALIILLQNIISVRKKKTKRNSRITSS